MLQEKGFEKIRSYSWPKINIFRKEYDGAKLLLSVYYYYGQLSVEFHQAESKMLINRRSYKDAKPTMISQGMPEELLNECQEVFNQINNFYKR